MILIRGSERTRTFPTLTVRLQPNSASTNTWNGAADRLGRFVDFLHPVSLSKRPLPEGSTLTTEVVWERQYGLASDPLSVYQSLIGQIICVEARYQYGNRVIKQVIFRGTLLTEGKAISENENGVSLMWNDANTLADDPIEKFIGAMAIGSVLELLDADNTIWPQDYAGRRLGRIDSSLFSMRQWTGAYSLPGVPMNAAFAQMLRGRHKLIPDINYQSDGTYVLTARERGTKEFDLVVGRINKAGGTPLYVADIPQANIQIDYSRVVRRIKGRGDYARKADTVTLTPAWDRGLDAAFFANPSLGDNDPAYEDVGRLFRFNVEMWPYNAEPHGPASIDDVAIIWGRRGVFDNWKRMRLDAQFVEAPTEASRNVFARSRRGGFASGSYRYVRLVPSLWFDYYTTEQNTNRTNGLPETPERTFMELELQAIKQDGILMTDTGYLGDLPIMRTRTHTNRDYSKLTAGTFYHDDGDVRTAATPEGLFDHTNALYAETRELLEDAQHAKETSNIGLNHVPLWLELGMTCRRLYDICGTKVERDLHWYTEGIDYTFNTGGDDSWTTKITTDRDIAAGLGGQGL